jgi:hypothetical protein
MRSKQSPSTRKISRQPADGARPGRPRHRSPKQTARLSCGIAVGGCGFHIDEFDNGDFIAVFWDGPHEARAVATAGDWNELAEAWDVEAARAGEVERVRIAERFFRARGWMPRGVRIFSS